MEPETHLLIAGRLRYAEDREVTPLLAQTSEVGKMLNGDAAMATVVIRPLTPADRSAWEPLWAGYLAFYQAQIPAAITDLTWQRFHDPQIPMHALGAFWDDQLVGIVQYLFHYSAWTSGPYCYLQDLFTAPDARGRGVGRALIEAVYAAALEAGASRVYWLTQETNTQAQALYDQIATRSGFIQYRKLFGERPA